MAWLTDPEALIALGTLILLEIVLGIDNIVVISILTQSLPPAQQPKARVMGLGLALFARVALLFSLSWMMQLTAPLFTILKEAISGRDLIMIVGGAFLIAKATHEIHNKLEGDEHAPSLKKKATSFTGVIVQILILDIVFSLDSVITAIGMAKDIWVMVTAVVIAVLMMMLLVNIVADYINGHPTIKMLALSFLVLIGFTLVAEGFDQHIPKGYIYSAIAFSVFVEVLNQRSSKKRSPVALRHPQRAEYAEGAGQAAR